MRPYMRAANVTWDGLDLSDVKEMDFTPAEYETCENVVTSEVKRYTFQVGPLELNSDLYFEVIRSVEEHTPDGTLVGEPIPIHQDDDDELTFSLSGQGHSLFDVGANADGDAQITIAGDIDHHTRSEYRLKLGVSDGKDPENNLDSRIGSVISVKINITEMTEIARSVVENSEGGTPVGDPIATAHADADTTFTLPPEDNGLFTVGKVSGNKAQIMVAPDAILNAEDASTHTLTLRSDTDGHVTDIVVTITVEDDPNETLAIHLSAEPAGRTQPVNTEVTITARVTGATVANSALRFEYIIRDQPPVPSQGAPHQPGRLPAARQPPIRTT